MSGHNYIVSTRVLPKTLAGLFEKAGLRLSMHDFIAIEFLKYNWQNSVRYIISSQNAVRALLSSRDIQKLRGKDLWVVGHKTKALLEAHNLPVYHSFENAKELMLNFNFDGRKTTFIAGALRMEHIEAVCRQNHFPLEVMEVYATKEKPIPINEEYDRVMFFSPSGVRSFVSKNTLEGKCAICVGHTTALEAKKYTTHCIVANETSQEGVVAAVLENKTYVTE